MKIYRLSFLSLRRRLSKTVFLMAGLALAVSSVVALSTISLSVNKSISEKLDEYGANIVIVPDTEELDLGYAGINVPGLIYGTTNLSASAAENIKTIKNKDNISIVSPKLIIVDTLMQKQTVISGVDFTSELKLKKWWKIEGKAPANSDHILLGSQLQKRLGAVIGQTIYLHGKALVVSGTLAETGSPDDNMLFMDLGETEKLFGRDGTLSLFEVSARCFDCPIEEIVSQLKQAVPGAKVTAIKQSIATKMDTMHRFEHFSWGISVLILLFCILMAITSISSAVNDRKQEIGTFRAIGFRQVHIIKLILTEVLFASLISGIAGYAAGIGISRFVVPMLSMSNNATIEMNSLMFILAVGLSMFVGLISSIYPAVKASRIDPTVAIRAL